MASSTNVNNRTVVHKSSSGVATNFPDVCKTPTPGGPVPLPYPNVATSSDTASGSTSVKIDGNPIMLKDSNFKISTGDEAGSIGGVASGCIKGIAEFVNYSFDVKVDGKNVPRLGDMMIQNKKNTPPMPEVQAPLIVAAVAKKKDKCKFCKKDEHDYADKPGSSQGSGPKLRRSIIKKVKTHGWYSGWRSLQAHHLICSESMNDDDWYKYCQLFGYNINHKKNGVMLPFNMRLACQLHVPLHRGNHSAGTAGSLSYPDAIKDELQKIKAEIQSGKYCSNPDALVEKLNNLSKMIIKKIDKFRWTITSDGKDYKAGGNGCADVKSITKKPNQACSCNRQHSLKSVKSKALILRNMTGLKIGT